MAEDNDSGLAEERAWALKLFARSPLKQEKFKQIISLLGGTEGRICLDIGADNGVISMLLRERGGEWHSADLTEQTVGSIRRLVGERVELIDGKHTPYHEAQFDFVVIIDFLEHIANDGDFIVELQRILKSDGILIVNVPNPKEGVFRWLKRLIGQSDEAHGHLRPGYRIEDLQQLFAGRFTIEGKSSYRRFFSDLVDTLITAALDLLKPGGRGEKGSVVTGVDLGKLKKSFAVYSLLAPVFMLMVRLDEICRFLHGNMLIVRARKVGESCRESV